MKGRLDELAIQCAQLAIERGARNLGLPQHVTDAAKAELTPVCQRLIAQHVPSDPFTLEGLLERAGILKKPEPAKEIR